MKFRKLATVVVFLFALTLAACGGKDAKKETETATKPAKQYVTEEPESVEKGWTWIHYGRNLEGATVTLRHRINVSSAVLPQLDKSVGEEEAWFKVQYPERYFLGVTLSVTPKNLKEKIFKPILPPLVVHRLDYEEDELVVFGHHKVCYPKVCTYGMTHTNPGQLIVNPERLVIYTSSSLWVFRDRPFEIRTPNGKKQRGTLGVHKDYNSDFWQVHQHVENTLDLTKGFEFRIRTAYGRVRWNVPAEDLGYSTFQHINLGVGLCDGPAGPNTVPIPFLDPPNGLSIPSTGYGAQRCH